MTEDTDYRSAVARAVEIRLVIDQAKNYIDGPKLVDAVLSTRDTEMVQLRAERDAHVHTLDHVLEQLHLALGALPEDASLATFPDALEQVAHLRAELAEAREELAQFVEASLEECDYTSDGESGGWEPDDYERATANIAEMHRVLLVRMQRLFQAQDREKELRWLHAEAAWQRDQARAHTEEWKAALGVYQGDIDTTPEEAVAALLAASVPFPDDWRRQMRRHVDTVETWIALQNLIDSWRGATTEEGSR